MANKKQISEESILQVTPDVIDSEIDDELVMMHIDSGSYFGLNPIATVVWQKLKSPISFGTIISELIEEYEVTEQACKEDVLTLLYQMVDQDLLTVA